ncbi:uncharacterized protein METZ01_LOCUS432507, partial [marine metagenome]
EPTGLFLQLYFSNSFLFKSLPIITPLFAIFYSHFLYLYNPIEYSNLL